MLLLKYLQDQQELHNRSTMPLDKSKSKKSIGKNISELESSGHKKSQSIAIALDVARKAGAKIKKKKK